MCAPSIPQSLDLDVPFAAFIFPLAALYAALPRLFSMRIAAAQHTTFQT